VLTRNQKEIRRRRACPYVGGKNKKCDPANGKIQKGIWKGDAVRRRGEISTISEERFAE